MVTKNVSAMSFKVATNGFGLGEVRAAANVLPLGAAGAK